MASPAAPVASSPREIRVFISLTFRDLQEEREELVKQIFPQLRRLCEIRGVILARRGSALGRATTKPKPKARSCPCAWADIERCPSYFIGLLGKRYGRVPEEIARELLET